MPDEPYEGLTVEELATLRSVEHLLGDGSIWAEPPNGMEDLVVAAISAETSRQAAAASTGRPRLRFLRGAGLTLLGAAAALLIVLGVGTVRNRDSRAAVTEVALGTTGTVNIERLPSGWRIDLDADLPRVEGARHYQASLEAPDGNRVPLGTFNDGRDVILWSGVSPKQVRTFVITIEPGGQEVLRAELPAA